MSPTWAIGRIARGKPTFTGFRQDAFHYTEDLHRLTGVTKVLSDSVRNAVPDAVSAGVTAAVTTAFGAVGGPLAAAGGAMAGSAASKLAKSAVGAKGGEGAAEGGREPQPRARLDQAPLAGADLSRFTAELAERLGVMKDLRPYNIRVSSYQISISRADERPERQAFLNSYIVDDLTLIAAALDRGNAGAALSQYQGRWVTGTGRPLAFSQQFAVNQIMRTLGGGSSGLFAVNGPPGTGKTTMLRDVIAAIVVNRAIELAGLTSPGEAFTDVREQWQPVRYSHTITTPNPRLTGFEIVVASSNNAAVENISTEIPGPKGVDGQWRDAAAAVDYFRQAAGHDAWAMMAARLGNRANRTAFTQDFWWNRESGMQNALREPAPDWQVAVASFRRALSRLQNLIGELRRQIRAARLHWGDHVPDGPEYAETAEPERIERREKSAPWADAEFTTARTELFLAALALHKAVIMGDARTFRRNLSALMDILGGKGRPSDAATLAAWQTFFFVVPVVSTTFASLDKLFGGLGCESLGWLFVDEAGQASPQVADRLAEHGTALPGPASDEPVWVGTPLRVHRRCDRLMFGISNQIAYEGLMVFGTSGPAAFPGRDVWLDIRSATSAGHWIPAEGEELRSVLRQLRDAGVSAAQIRVISPFRMVVSQAMKVHAGSRPGSPICSTLPSPAPGVVSTSSATGTPGAMSRTSRSWLPASPLGYHRRVLRFCGRETSAGLTNLQLAGQRVIGSYPGLRPSASLFTDISNGQVAGVIFFGENISSEPQIAGVITQLRQAQAVAAAAGAGTGAGQNLAGVGVAATAKHFPGLGSATKSQNTDNGPVTLTVSLAKLHSIDEVPYPAAIGAGVKLVMVSWAIYPALDAALPAGLSPTVIGKELRGRNAFIGVTITDALEAGALSAFGTTGQRAVAAAGAGMDLVLCSARDASQGEAATAALAGALGSGQLDPAAFNAAVNRVTALRASLF
jgi:hypothetical protein